MLYLHYSTSYDYGFSHNAHEFNINARVQKTFLDGNLTAAFFANLCLYAVHRRIPHV